MKHAWFLTMLETILGAVSAIIFGVIANLLTPYVREILRLPPEKKETPSHTQPAIPQEPEDIETVRARNREQLRALAWQAYLYGISFFFVYMAIYLPLIFSVPINGQLDLSHTRVGIDYFIAREKFSILAVLLAAALFAPLYLLAQKIAQGVAAIWSRFYYVGPYRFGAFITLAVGLLSLVLSGHVIYLLYPSKSYIDAILLPFVLFFVVVALAASRK